MKYWNNAWNPVNGCTKCSEGCEHCFSEIQASFKEKNNSKYNFNNVFVSEKILQKEFDQKNETIMVASQSDLFHPAVSDKYIDAILRKCAFCKSKRFLILTHRPDRMVKYFSDSSVVSRIKGKHFKFDFENLFFGVTVESEKSLYRIDLLNTCKHIKHRFVAFEPLLTAIDCDTHINTMEWVIVGAESGKNARECKTEWIDDIVNVCHSNNVPVFVNNINENGNITDKFEKAGYRQNFFEKEWK